MPESEFSGDPRTERERYRDLFLRSGVDRGYAEVCAQIAVDEARSRPRRQGFATGGFVPLGPAVVVVGDQSPESVVITNG